MSRSVFDPSFGDRGTVMVPVDLEVLREALHSSFIMSGDFDDVINFIVALDLSMADWDVTCKLIAHFKALELEMMAEDPSEPPVDPMKIIAETKNP